MQTYVLSHNYLNDKNLKYRNNDEGTEENLTLRLRSTEQKTTFRAENMTTLPGGWMLKEGAELNYMDYTDRERRLLSVGDWSAYVPIWDLSHTEPRSLRLIRLRKNDGVRRSGCGQTAIIIRRACPVRGNSYLRALLSVMFSHPIGRRQLRQAGITNCRLTRRWAIKTRQTGWSTGIYVI